MQVQSSAKLASVLAAEHKPQPHSSHSLAQHTGTPRTCRRKREPDGLLEADAKFCDPLQLQLQWLQQRWGAQEQLQRLAAVCCRCENQVLEMLAPVPGKVQLVPGPLPLPIPAQAFYFEKASSLQHSQRHGLHRFSVELGRTDSFYNSNSNPLIERL